jgi:probable HAF family extracellular repeat protein
MTGDRRWQTYVVVGLALALPSAARASSTAYVPFDLGTYTVAQPAGSAAAVNDAGEVVGVAGVPMAWTDAGGVTPVKALASPTAISPNGRIAGSTGIEGSLDYSDAAYAWTSAADPAPVLLGSLDGPGTVAYAINDAGEVVGQSTTNEATTYAHAFVWTPAGGMRDIGTLGGPSSAATGVNASGVVVGWAETADGTPHAFRWTPTGGMVNLNLVSPGSFSEAMAINDNGQIVGGFDPGAAPQVDAFSWTQAGGLVDIGSLTGSTGSVATAVSDSGQVVGYEGGSVVSDAFSWTAAGGEQDLRGLGGSESKALGVNDAGLIVGESSTADNTVNATIWTPAGAPPLAPSRPFLPGEDHFRVNSNTASWDAHGVGVCGFAAAADGTATVYRDGVAIGTAAVDPSDGRWCVGDTVPTDGTFAYSATLTDALGRVSGRGASFNVDVETSPTVTITGAPSGTYDVTDIPARPSFTATSFGSILGGTRDSWIGPSTSSGIGHYVYAVTAQDTFGHQTTAMRTYDVVYGPALNLATAAGRYAVGDTVPVRFRAVNGGPITDIVASLTVTAGSQVGYLVPSPAPPAATRLTYDPSTQQYELDLRTDRAYTNPDGTSVAAFAPGAYTLTIALDDGTTRTRQITLGPAPLQIARAAATAAKATAGRAFALSFAVAPRGTKLAPTSPKVSCTARIGTRALHPNHSYRSGKVQLTIAIPRGTRGKLLTVRLTIAAGGTTSTRVSTYRIH